MCIFFNFDHLRITLQSSDLNWGTKFRAPSLSLPPLIFSFLQAFIHGFLRFFLTHLFLEVASPTIFVPSPFHCHSSSRSKGLHWWRRSKAYKLHMELHQKATPSKAKNSSKCHPFLQFLHFTSSHSRKNHVLSNFRILFRFYFMNLCFPFNEMQFTFLNDWMTLCSKGLCSES